MEEKKIEETEEQKKKREKTLNKQVAYLLLILVLLLISFLIAYEIFKPKQYFDYEGLKIYPAKAKGIDELFYLIYISGNGVTNEVFIRNDPRKMNVSVEVDDLFNDISRVWVTMPPEIESGGVIAGNDLGAFTSKISLKTDFALTNASLNGDYAEKTCADATKTTRVFFITLGNETRVYEDNNCIIIEGNNYDDLVKAADSLVVKWILRLKIA